MIRRCLFALSTVLVVAACSTPDISRDVDPIGDFRMGFNIVVANDVQKGPVSRDATEKELTDAVRAAMEERIGRYDGDGLYHIGLRIEAYVLGRTGVPLVYAPKSVFIVLMNIWDDATQQKLNEEPIRITAFDTIGGPFVGSGIALDREEQMQALAFNTAKEVEDLLKENEKAWFSPKPGRGRVNFRRDPATGRQATGGNDATNLGRAANAAADAAEAGASPDEALAAGRAAQADG